MRRIINLLTLVFQVGLAFILTVSIYMVFALLDSDFGFDGLFGLLIIQPILGSILSILTIVICLILGLPIRLNQTLEQWWSSKFYLPFAGIALGFTLLVLSTLPQFLETKVVLLDETEMLKSVPNWKLAAAGWFITAFMATHLFPPMFVTRILENFRIKFTGQDKKNAL